MMPAMLAVPVRSSTSTVWVAYQARSSQPVCMQLRPGAGLVMVTDVNAGAMVNWGRRRGDYSASGRRLRVVLGTGESYKGFLYLRLILRAMLRAGLGRDAVVLSLGGGVVGDVAGLAAACYMRGVSIVQHPTTLLACVDSAMGGKVGINTGAFKNAVGCIHPPRYMEAQMGRVAALPWRQWRAGLAEAAKMGACLDRDFYCWLAVHSHDVARRAAPAVASMVSRCAELKSYVTARDDVEAGARACLNLGHTIGHAVESGMRYRHWLHGEAVSLGIVLMAYSSHRLGLLPRADAAQIVRMLASLLLPVRRPLGVDAARLADALSADKKNRGESVCVVLLRGIGDCVALEVPRDAMLCAWSGAVHRHTSGSDI